MTRVDKESAWGADVRAALVDLAAHYAECHLRDPLNPELRRLAVDASWVEFAHTPQIPHVGIVRLLLTAVREAHSRNGIFVFCINDQLPPRILPESRYTPVAINGTNVSKPPRFGIPKSKAAMAMCQITAPKATELDCFEARWRQLCSDAQETGAFDILREASLACGSLSAWLTRVTLGLTGLKPLIVPTWQLGHAIPGQFKELLEKAPDRFWRHCEACGYRLGRFHKAVASCPCCGTRGTSSHAIPDVIARQALMNAAGLALRVSGTEKAYQGEADVFSETVLSTKPPARLRVTGRTMVYDSGNNPIERCSLFQLAISGSNLFGEMTPPPADPQSQWTLKWDAMSGRYVSA